MHIQLYISFVFAIYLGTVISSAVGQSLTFLGDNNENYPLTASAGNFTKVGDSVYFSASGAYGNELYRTDGTSQGVELVKDLTPGEAGTALDRFTAVQSSLYFAVKAPGEIKYSLWKCDGSATSTSAVDLSHLGYDSIGSGSNFAVLGNELFFSLDNFFGPLAKTDGTDAGTTIVSNLTLANSSGLFTWKGEVYFAATSHVTGSDGLYKTDGTTTGTIKICDLHFPFFHSPIVVEDTFYFVSSGQLWKTNGTIDGTVKISGAGASAVRRMWSTGNQLFFVAFLQTTGEELWVTSPESTEAELVKEMIPGIRTPYYVDAVGLNNHLIFTIADETLNGLWKTDGTDEGTTIIKPGGEAWQVAHSNMVKAGNCAYFEVLTSAGNKIWKTDGTLPGTVSVNNLTTSDEPYHFSFCGEAGGDLYFLAAGPSGLTKLYRLRDDTQEASSLDFKSGNPAGLEMSQTAPYVAHSKAYYVVSDGLHGVEPWVTDGTADGTYLLDDLDQLNFHNAAYSYSRKFVTCGNHVLFLTRDEHTIKLWQTSGSRGDVSLLKTFPADHSLSHFVQVGQILYFFENYTYVAFLWRTDGTVDGTYPVAAPQTLFINTPLVAAMENGIVFSADDKATSSGMELWKVENNAAGVSFVKDIYPGAQSSMTRDPSANYTITMNGEAYFFANDDIHGRELWKSDGTNEGTNIVKEIIPGNNPYYGSLKSAFIAPTAAGEYLFFSHDGFWCTDGTEAGTLKLSSEHGPQADSEVDGASKAFINGKIIYAVNSTYYNELWITDGTPEGTLQLADVNAVRDDHYLQQFVSTGNAVYFVADDFTHGRELWVTDGTSAGTRMVRDIKPGQASSLPAQLTVLGDYVFFTADDGVHGQEIWYSSLSMGTAELLQDLEAGPRGSRPKAFAQIGGAVTMSAFTSQTGTDLWAIKVPPRASIDDWTLFE